MPAKNTPLDSLKNAVLRATDGLGGATDELAGSTCDHGHDSELEWFDSVSMGLWLAIAEHVPGIEWNYSLGIATFTPAGRRALITYDDGTPVFVHIDHGNYATDYYPRFDGNFADFLETFEGWCAIDEAESIAYEAAHPFPGR